MVSAGFQMMGTALCIIGWIGVIIVCALPMWKVTEFHNGIVMGQTFWEGIWMTCVVKSTGQKQCKVYDPMMALTSDLQAARALIIISFLLGIVGILLAILLAIAGGKCTNCMDEAAKAKIGVASGVIFILTGLLCLIPVCWTANTIVQNFDNPLTMHVKKRELGAALFIGWGASGILILGGALLCANCPPKDKYAAKYAATRPNAPKDFEGVRAKETEGEDMSQML